MKQIAWTIRYEGRQDIVKVTTLSELEKVLRTLDLPGVAPVDFILIDVETHDEGEYRHDVGDEHWSLGWSKIGGMVDRS